MKIVLFLILIFAVSLAQQDFPASLMEMNNPDYLRKNSGPWKQLENDYFKLFASIEIHDDSLVDSILIYQNENRTHILKILNIDPSEQSPKINLWIFNDDQEKYLKTQVRSNAHCLAEYHSVYYNKDNAMGAHELGHYLVETNWGQLKSDRFDMLISEGFAFLVDEGKFFNYDYYVLARDYIKNDNYLVCNITEDSPGSYKKKAFVSAAFLKYLIRQFGIDRFKDLWQTIRDDDGIFEQVYHKSFSQLETDFYNFLNEYEERAF